MNHTSGLDAVGIIMRRQIQQITERIWLCAFGYAQISLQETSNTLVALSEIEIEKRN